MKLGSSIWKMWVKLSWSIGQDIPAGLFDHCRPIPTPNKTWHANKQIVLTSAVKNVDSGVHLQRAGRSQPSLSSLKQSRAPTILATSSQRNITRAKSINLFELFDWLPKRKKRILTSSLSTYCLVRDGTTNTINS